MDELLAQPTRRRIFDVVSKNPGASARDVQRLAGLAWGETAYHLDQLTRAGALRRERGGRRDYYFAPEMGWEDRRLFQALRNPAQRRLLLQLSETSGLTLNDLATRVGVSLSTASFHTRKLLGQAVIEGYRDGNVQRYRVLKPRRVAELVKGYRESFEDRLVERFVDSWAGLLGG
jgi:predicted transcriptional regulator